MRKYIYPLIIFSIITHIGLAAQPAEKLDGHAEKGYQLFETGRYRAAQAELLKALEAIDIDLRGGEERIRYMLVQCAGYLEESNSVALSRDFLDRYPTSIYANDIRFTLANYYYTDGNYSRAISAYLEVDRLSLPVIQREEYAFKLGYSYFMQADYEKAYTYFAGIGTGRYASHSRYYIAYIDYINGNYTAAKRGFSALLTDENYARIIPFYLLQIEFLEGNYNYVVSEGDALLATAAGSRTAEIARIMAESWFHLGDYAKTLSYITTYRRAGGQMGRAEFYLKGFSDYMRNDISEAISSLQRVAGPDDKLTQNAAYHLGGAYLRSGDRREAMRAFSMAADADYDPAIREDALFNYGKLQFELGGGVFNEAINILTRYISEYPASKRVSEAREYLVAAYYNSRNYEAAYEAIKMLSDPDNNTKAALQRISYFRALEFFVAGDYDSAEKILDESLSYRFAPKYTALAMFWKGEIEFRRGNYRAAVPLYREYVSLSPATETEHVMAMYNLGYSYFNLRQWGESKTWFDRFLREYKQLDSFAADTYNRIGDVQFARREFWPAIESYQAASAIDAPEKYYGQYQRAVVLGLAGRNDRKVEALGSIISTGRGGYVSEALYELGRTYISMERFTDAANTLKQFVATYPSSIRYPAALADLGLIYQNLGNNPTALSYYKTVIEKAPNSPEARNAILAVKSLYVEMNDVDGYFNYASRSGIETDLGVVARDSLTYAAAERVYLSAAPRTSAAASLRDYVDKFPRGAYRPNALYYLSDAYLADNRPNEAIIALSELSDVPFNSFTVRGLEKLGQLLFEDSRFDEASDTYLKLARTAVSHDTAGKAYARYLASTAAVGNPDKTIAAAQIVEAAPAATAEIKREARFMRAVALADKGIVAESDAIFTELATEAQTAIGAESTYRVIESFYKNGRLADAENKIMEFSAMNTPHSYFLGKAFLILGDIYIGRGDTFQARATLQSIVDGYSPADDGVIDAARRRIENL